MSFPTRYNENVQTAGADATKIAREYVIHRENIRFWRKVFIERAPEVCAAIRIIYVADSNLTPRNFYWAVLHQFGVTPHFYRGDAKRQLHKVILGLYEDEKKIPVIIIDESHLLSREMLEEIRFLTNFQMDSFSPMGLILVGQPELKKVLKLQVFEAIMLASS